VLEDVMEDEKMRREETVGVSRLEVPADG